MGICPICQAESENLGGLCTCAQSHIIREDALQAAASDPLLGRLIARRFALIDELGSGAMGVVYEAIQHPVKRRCAVKVLQADLSQKESLRQRFIREATAASRLNHPNLVTLYDFGVEEDGLSFIAMEYLNGIPLSDLSPYTQLDIDAIVHILRQILRALSGAHRLGVVHRDLKPDNIFLCELGGDRLFVKVMDFGLAKLTEDDSIDRELTIAGEVFGTPLYMSPEQCLSAEDIGIPSDIYSFGALAYEMICARRLFDGKNAMAVMHAHVSKAPPPLFPRPGLELASKLTEVIKHCLFKEPARRHQSADEVLHHLEEALGLRSGPGIKAPDLKKEVEEDSDLVALTPSMFDLKLNGAPVTTQSSSWLHAPPQGSPRWLIPGRDEIRAQRVAANPPPKKPEDEES